MGFNNLHIARIAITLQDCKHGQEAFRIVTAVNTFCKENKIRAKNIRTIIFSQTKDINMQNPATLLRTSPDFSEVALFCTSEPEYDGSLPLTIRMLVMFTKFTPYRYSPKAVYMYGAEKLRPDLATTVSSK